jgi:two-component system LytT family response regulator
MKSEPMRTLIVDDEELARKGLRRDLAEDPAIEIVGECADGFEAVRAAVELKPDLVLLDIQMPKLNGFEVLELLDPSITIIFITAHDQHAVRAFQVNAVDYLLKPVDPARLMEALERARERRRKRKVVPVEALAEAARQPGAPASRVLVRDGSKVHVIPADAIDYIQAQDDFIEIHAGGKRHLKQQTLSSIEASLDPARFARIHRTYVLNLDRLARIELIAKDRHVAILRDGSQLPLSRAGYLRLRSLL